MTSTILFLVAAFFAPQTPSGEKLPLQVLYAGNPGTPYSAAWEKFLGEHCARAQFVAGSKLKREDLAGFDLLVVDGEVTAHDAQGGMKLKNEKLRMTLDELQGFPVVLMGGQGGFFSDDLKLKTSWHAG
ncbi:MAG TPA: hypothetical protein VM509_02880 [Planctomycetota bacterium]|nr:hypothetical protein [Planctomycetota bacterium]